MKKLNLDQYTSKELVYSESINTSSTLSTLVNCSTLKYFNIASWLVSFTATMTVIISWAFTSSSISYTLLPSCYEEYKNGWDKEHELSGVDSIWLRKRWQYRWFASAAWYIFSNKSGAKKSSESKKHKYFPCAFCIPKFLAVPAYWFLCLNTFMRKSFCIYGACFGW